MELLQEAIGRLREVFARYPVREVLEGCPHCRGDVSTVHPDLFAFSLRLGNTVGTHEDLKSFLPALLEALVSTDELDQDIVLGRLAGWRDWPEDEQEAVDGFLLASWRVLISAYPSNLGSFHEATDFLLAAQPAYVSLERFLQVWEGTRTRSADRHIADTVRHWVLSRRELSPLVVAWLHRPPVRARLYLALSAAPAAPEGDEFARALDVLEVPEAGTPA